MIAYENHQRVINTKCLCLYTYIHVDDGLDVCNHINHIQKKLARETYAIETVKRLYLLII